MSADVTTPDDPGAAPPTPPAPTAPVVFIAPPRPGELTPWWRTVTAVTWIAVAVALAAVWKTSEQLGLATWWLGPRGEPRPVAVQLLPFVPSVVMVLAAANRLRFLSWWGAVCAGLVAAVGVADLGTVTRLGVVEIAIAVAALAVSLASAAGAYRPVGDADAPGTTDAGT